METMLEFDKRVVRHSDRVSFLSLVTRNEMRREADVTIGILIQRTTIGT